MIHIEQAEDTDLETIINIQRAISRLFMRNIRINTTPIWRSESGFAGSWLSGPIVFIILSKTTRRFWALSA